MANNSDTNFFIETKYVVSQSGGIPYYSTIQSAINAAAAAGGGIVYIRDGIYFEDLTLLNKVMLEGDNGTGDYFSSIGLKNATIVGSHTFSPSATSGIGISNLFFFTANASSTSAFTFSPSSGTLEIDFCKCTIDPGANAGTGTGLVISPSGSALVNIRITESTLVGVSTSKIATVGTNSSLTLTQCSLSSFSDCIFLSAATSSITSSFCSYYSQAGAAVTMTANGLFNSFYDIFNVSSFIVDTSGAFGRVFYAHATIKAGSTSFNSQLTITRVPQNPNTFPTTNGQIAIGSTGKMPILSTLTAGTGMAVTNGAGSISIAAAPPGGAYLSWQSISANTTLASNNGYIVSSGALSLALPTTASLGSIIVVILTGGTSWTITQAAGQSIRIGNITTTTGTGGSTTSSATGDAMLLMCTTANTSWLAYSIIGNILVI
jgi:hypothetical protein